MINNNLININKKLGVSTKWTFLEGFSVYGGGEIYEVYKFGETLDFEDKDNPYYKEREKSEKIRRMMTKTHFIIRNFSGSHKYLDKKYFINTQAQKSEKYPHHAEDIISYLRKVVNSKYVFWDLEQYFRLEEYESIWNIYSFSSLDWRKGTSLASNAFPLPVIKTWVKRWDNLKTQYNDLWARLIFSVNIPDGIFEMYSKPIIVAKPLTEEEKAEEAKSIDPVTLADANSTYISSDGKYKYYLKDGWIVEDVENNKNIPFKGNAVIEFYGQVGEMVDTIESNTGQLVVGLTSWDKPDYTIVFKPNDPSSKMLMNLIKDQIAKDLDNNDLYGARIIFEESCGLFTTSAHSMGGFLYKSSWRGEMVYLKTSTPLRILETRVDKWCKGDGGPSDECVRTKEYYIGK